MWKEEGGAGYVPGRGIILCDTTVPGKVINVILSYLEKLLSDTIVPGKSY